ncbi:MAG: hypothetical protein ABI551_27370, partial [Polyangiaceae bacterium]
LQEPAAKLLVPESAPRLRRFLDALNALEGEWVFDALKKVNDAAVADEKDRGFKDVMQPARIALAGRTASIGLAEIMDVVGRAQSIARLERAIALAEGKK